MPSLYFPDVCRFRRKDILCKCAQGSCTYSLYSLNYGRRWVPSPLKYRRCAACTCVLVSFSGRWWAPSPMNYRRNAACTCVLVSLFENKNIMFFNKENEYTSTCGTSPVIHKRWRPPASRKRSEYTSTCGASPAIHRRWSPPASRIQRVQGVHSSSLRTFAHQL